MAETSFENKVGILSYLWMNYREDEDWKDFIEYNDLGLPLAYMLDNQVVELTAVDEDDEEDYSNGAFFIENTWEMFLSKVGLEDTGFDDIEEILGTDESGWGEEDEDGEDYEIPVVNVSGVDEEDDELGYSEGYNDGYANGYTSGAEAEQLRVQEVISMHKRWAKEKNRASEFMFWDSAGEVLTPINFEYSEEKYKQSLEDDGF